MKAYLLAIDQGTSNSRALIFDQLGNPLSQYELALTQYYPQDGWVEHNPEELLNNTITCCKEALKAAKLSAQQIAAIGIANQRETTLIWDKKTGQPIYPAIVWQDRRTSDICRQFANLPINATIECKTGLRLDPYFSASKIMWLLEHVPDARKRALNGELLFGTVDTFLLWKLTHGKSHKTDATNASRTLLFNIHEQKWDQEILDAFDIPNLLLPTVFDSAADFGEMDARFLGAAIPITAMAGDQQAATVGQACFKSGMLKATFGTGCFVLLNTGENVIQSHTGMLGTVAYRLKHHTTYGLEGSIFSAGVTVKWLRDKLGMIATAAETETFAQGINGTDGVYLVPAFTGLGAPHWDPDARCALLGITANTSSAEIARAALESVAYQTRDLLEAMTLDSQSSLTTLRVDGGMVVNNWLLQFLADMLQLEVERPACIETTALGAAFLAGLQIGLYQSLDDIAALWQMNSRFTPRMSEKTREPLYAGWQKAVARVLRKKE